VLTLVVTISLVKKKSHTETETPPIVAFGVKEPFPKLSPAMVILVLPSVGPFWGSMFDTEEILQTKYII
jgi:hypothetical protein